MKVSNTAGVLGRQPAFILFAERRPQTPEAIALVFEEKTSHYRELTIVQ